MRCCSQDSPQDWVISILTLVVGLAPENLPELFDSVAVSTDALLNDLNVASSATQILLALDKIGQL